ncbi:uncharacterized protein LOC103719089 isoform X2 [Phoenix dactylifera]|uniref:Uncharacterized protein LOC103719089 isoform X2 n=1 Tax=Phoenix dactylifera TaxID=42345 RepID=A0A8B9A309_PHODC|nr:uncharacterized protein LOC103719089 isoform X2 [Phoenix dactylifera]XP_038977753.1 uncharacterized protein LOC103719089 isoform X2 [Phoenix dactylifera]XP_038977754.1 uncharacterized protein LOC103719089 isoform X2 [Phoenix dactylifera]
MEKYLEEECLCCCVLKLHIFTMARRVRTRLPARHIPRSFSQQHIILRALHRGHINQAITSHRSHLQFPPIRRSRWSRSLHGAPPVRSLHGAPRVRSLHRAPRARSLHRAPPVHSLRSHLQLPSLQARSRPLSASRAAPIRSPHHHLQVMELERHGYSNMLELGPSANYLWSQETSLLETKAMEVDEEVRTLKEELEAIQQEHAELRQKQRELVAQLSVLLETIRAIKSQASEATKCDDICFQPNPSLRSHLQVMGPERRGNVHMLELSVSPSEVLSQPTSFVEVIRKFSEQIEEVRTLKEKAQAVRLSNAKLRQKHVELESLAKAIQSQLLKEYICHDTCSPPSHTKQVLLPIKNSTDQEGLHMQQIGSSSSSQIVPQNQIADISHDAGTPAI